MFRIKELIVYREYEQGQDDILKDMDAILHQMQHADPDMEEIRGKYYSASTD